MPDDTSQLPKESETEHSIELTPEVAKPTTDPVQEPVETGTPKEPEPVPEIIAESPVQPEPPVEIQAEVEKKPLIEEPSTDPISAETAHSENEPFREAATEPPQEQPEAVPVTEVLTEPDPVPSEPVQASEPSPIAEPPPNPAPAPQSTPRAPLPPFANFTTRAREMLVKARASIQSRKRKKLDKILVLLDEKKNIGNDDVEKLLHVSDATATRYLNQLEREGKIVQVGKTGQSVRYVRSS